MASLNWIGKEAVIGHHREVPYHLLEGNAALSIGENDGVGSGNLLVQATTCSPSKPCCRITPARSNASTSIRRTTRATRNGSTTTT